MFKALMIMLLVVAAIAMVAYAEDLETAEQRYGHRGGHYGGRGGHYGGGHYGGGHGRGGGHRGGHRYG